MPVGQVLLCEGCDRASEESMQALHDTVDSWMVGRCSDPPDAMQTEQGVEDFIAKL